MGVFDRMGRAISSNFNALLDKAEDPRKSIDLTLSEMAEQIRAARQEVVRSVAAEKQLRARVQELDRESEKWDRRAELAVKCGEDELAREALTQRRRVTGERDRAEAMRAEQRSMALEMKTELERMEHKLMEFEARKNTLVAQVEQAKSGGGAESLGARGAGGKAFDEFRRMEDQIEGVEVALTARREVEEALGGGAGPGGMTRPEVEARFHALECDGPSGHGASGQTEVDHELAQLKQRLRVSQ
ncbi:PspA/IM30 family protein [Myxococcota bacterium]